MKQRLLPILIAITLLVGLFPAGVATADTLEPNNDFASAKVLTIGSTGISSYIGVSGDEDYYKFTPTTTGWINVSLVVPAAADYDIEVYDGAQSSLRYATAWGNGVDESVNIQVTANSTYYVRVYAWDSSYAASSTYKVAAQSSVSTTGVDPYEPNNTRPTAKAITAGTSYTSRTAPYGDSVEGYSSYDEDWYTFTPTSNSVINATLTVPTSLDVDYDLELYVDGEEFSIAGSYNYAGDSESITDVVLLAGRKYYLMVRSYADTTYTYTLRYTTTAISDPYESNNTTATAYAITSGTTYTSKISVQGDVDYYKFTTSSTYQQVADLTINIPMWDYYDVAIVDAAGNVMGEPIDGFTGDQQRSVLLNKATTYYLRIKGYQDSWWSHINSYSFNLTLTNAVDTFEPNDLITQGAAMTAGTIYNSKIMTATDVDHYSFTPTTAGPAVVKLVNPSAGPSYDLELLDANGNQLQVGACCDTRYIVYQVTSGTKYIVRVSHVYGEYSLSQQYSLQWGFDPYEPEFGSDDTPVEATSGTSYTAKISYPGDQDWFNFTPASDGVLRSTLTVPTGLNHDLELFDSNWTLLGEGINGPGVAESVTYPVEGGQTYQIRVTGADWANDSLTASYTFKAFLDPFEPNDTYDRAYDVSPDTGYSDRWVGTYPAYLYTSGDVDWYKFSGGEGNDGWLKLTLAVPTGKNYDLELLDSNQTVLKRSASTTTGATETITWAVRGLDEFYIRVYGYSNAYSATLPYTLTVDHINDPGEPDSTLTTAYLATTGYGFYDAKIANSTDVDYIKYVSPSNGMLYVQHRRPPTLDYSWTNTDIQLLNSSGTVLASGTAGESIEQRLISYRVTAGTSYYIKVSGTSGAFNEEFVYFTDYYVDPYEPNDTSTQALNMTVGQEYLGKIRSASDVDYFSFYRTSTSGPFTVNLEVPEGLNYNIQLFDTNMTPVPAQVTTDGNRKIIEADQSVSTRFYIKVTSVNGSWDWENPYKVSVYMDSFEPNNTQDKARSLYEGNLYRSFITSATDVDYYSFMPQMDGTLLSQNNFRYQFRFVMQQPSVATYDVQLLNASGQVLAKGAEIDRHPLTLNATYYLRIASTGEAFSATEPYRFGYTMDRYEDNDTVARAYPLPLNTEFGSTLGAPGDVDIFGVTPAQDSRFTVNMTSFGPNYRYEVIDGSGQVLSTADSDNSPVLEAFLKGGMPYYLRVTGVTQDDWMVGESYLLKAWLDPDTYEPNDTMAKATPVSAGTTYTSYISTTTDADWYTFTNSGGSSSTFDLTFTPGSGRYYTVHLKDSTGWDVDTLDASGSTSQLSMSIPSGQFYLWIEPLNSTPQSTKPYSFTFNLTSTNDINEPNDAWGSASFVDPGQTYTAQISRPGDIDHYTFYVPSDSDATITLTVPEGLNFDLYLHDAQDPPLAQSTNGPGQAETITLSLLGDDWLSLRIVGATSADWSASATYTFQITLTPPIIVPPIPAGTDPVPAEDPAPVEEPTSGSPAPVEEPTSGDQVPVEEPTSGDPAPVEEPTSGDPAPVEEPTSGDPAPIEEPISGDPAPIEEPISGDPAPATETVDG